MKKTTKKLVILAVAVTLLSGCSWRKAWKWFEEMEWEREDEIVRVVDVLPR